MKQSLSKIIRYGAVALVAVAIALFISPARKAEQPAIPVEMPISYADYEGPLLQSGEDDESLMEETLVIYSPSEDFSSVTMSAQSVLLGRYETKYEGVVKTVLKSLRGVVGAEGHRMNIYLLSLVKTDDIVIVNLSGDTGMSDMEQFIMAYCITNTLTEFPEVKHVSLLLDDKAANISGVPYGVLSRFTGDPQVEYWQLVSKVEALLSESDIAPSFSLPVTMYFGNSSFLVGEVREIACYADTSKMLPSVIEELTKGPRDSKTMERLLPSDAKLYSAEINERESGGFDIKLNISGAVSSFFARNKVGPMLAVSSIALSLFDFYPELEYVSVYFTDGLQDEYAAVTRSGCELLLGSAITLYFPIEGRGLIVPVERAVSSYMLSRSDILIREMVSSPLPSETNMREITSMLPAGAVTDDIVRIWQQKDVAYIEVTKNFLECLRKMDADGEKSVVYCIVNTLLSNRNVSAVLFTVEGMECDNIPGRLNLSEPVYYNPGIIYKE